MSKIDFLNHLNSKLLESLLNNYGKENFDEYRFGSYQNNSFKSTLKDLLRKKFTPNSEIKNLINAYNSMIPQIHDDLNLLYKNLSETDQRLMVDIIAYRILGYQKVKLPLSSQNYWKNYEKVKYLISSSDTIDPNFLHFILKKFNLNSIGYDLEIYFTESGIVTDYIIEQYAYKTGDNNFIQADEGDVVLDLGGCWGDTALYFAHKVGETGKVYSFEFIPNNLKIFSKNLDLNPTLKERITIIKNPVSKISDMQMYYLDKGPGSIVSDELVENSTGKIETISIDDFVDRYNISKLDYIKMDIEGAEPFALEGAINSIKRFRPKLAIAIYHSLNDFVNIPKWILNLDLDYKLYLGHYTIFAEETILFAKPE
jgi:FkbM family methyltransferase